jgi:serine/threonine protein kinase
LPAHLSDDEEFQRRFRREAHAAARLNNPHVIPIHHYGEIDGRLYVDMRLIEGRDLGSVLAEGPLDPARAVRGCDSRRTFPATSANSASRRSWASWG